MKWRVEVVCVDAEGEERRRAVLELERRQLSMETLGLNLREGKAILKGVQNSMVAEQITPGRDKAVPPA